MKAAEKEERRAYLGASDFAAILGIDRFRKPIDVWMEKTGKSAPREDDEDEGPAAWGRFLENVLLQRWMKETGLPLAYHGRRKVNFTHPDFPFIRATPDGYHRAPIIRGMKGGGRGRPPLPAIEYCVEAKTSRAGRGFGEAGTDEVPRYYKVQAIVQAAVTGAPVVHMPVLIAGSDFRRYVIEPTEKQRTAVIAAGVEFWNERVLPGVEPDELSEEYLRQKWEADSGEDLIATDADVKLVEEYRLARTARENAETEEQTTKVAVMARIGDHARLLGPGFTITYKKSKDGETTAWEAEAAAFREIVMQSKVPIELLKSHGARTLEELLNFLHSMHTKPKPGVRSFRPTFHEEEE